MANAASVRAHLACPSRFATEPPAGASAKNREKIFGEERGIFDEKNWISGETYYFAFVLICALEPDGFRLRDAAAAARAVSLITSEQRLHYN
ncbi:MAG: hypothetical protein ACLGJB_26955 [Blastocatellia bacterium]